MKVFIAEYTNEDRTGNQCLEMEILAPDLGTAYEIVNQHYPTLSIDNIFAKADAYDFE